MGMELRSGPKFLLGDYVGADQADPVFGKIETMGWAKGEGIYVRTATGELTGPWEPEDLWHDPSAHVDYPHEPGTLYDCPMCEVMMAQDDDAAQEQAA